MNEQLILLVVKADFEAHVQVAKAGEFDRFMNPHILSAQLHDVRPLLGEEFFADLVINRAVTKYVELLAGGSYTYNSKVYFYEGLKKAIVHFAYARYAIKSGAVDAGTGLVKKTTDHSENLDSKAISRENEYHRQMGVAAINDVIKFLKRNTTTYPLFTFCESTVGKSKVRITPVSRY